MNRPSTITIDRRFEGPPGAANGGYVCGRLAVFLDGPATVRLRAPTPLEMPLEVRRVEDTVLLVAPDDGATIVEGRLAALHLDVPPPPSWTEAEAASGSYRGFADHPLPNCFVCGTNREPGEGMRIFPGPISGRDLVACPWVPAPHWGGSDGRVRPEFVWAALDCPGAFSFPQIENGVVVAGEISASIGEDVMIGQRHIVVGWKFDQQGRKHFTGTAVFTESGECLAQARTVWFEVLHPPSVPGR